MRSVFTCYTVSLFFDCYTSFFSVTFGLREQSRQAFLHCSESNISLYSVFQIPAVPLYLGADLLSHTNVRTENHPRYHAKFAKKGLATKIKFSPGNTLNTKSFGKISFTHMKLATVLDFIKLNNTA